MHRGYTATTNGGGQRGLNRGNQRRDQCHIAQEQSPAAAAAANADRNNADGDEDHGENKDRRGDDTGFRAASIAPVASVAPHHDRLQLVLHPDSGATRHGHFISADDARSLPTRENEIRVDQLDGKRPLL